MNKAQSHYSNFLVLSTDTTGYTLDAELLSCTLVNQDGEVLVNDLVLPVEATEWPKAEKVHGLSPSRVFKEGINLSELNTKLKDKMEGYEHVIMYNSHFHQRFIAPELFEGKKAVCLMKHSLPFINNHPSYSSLSNHLKLHVLAELFGLHESNNEQRSSLINAILTCDVWKFMLKESVHLENEADEIFCGNIDVYYY